VKVDLYIPRKCNATNRIIPAKDYASVQIAVGHVDANGVYNGESTMFAFCGFVRRSGSADANITRLSQQKGFVKSFPNIA